MEVIKIEKTTTKLGEINRNTKGTLMKIIRYENNGDIDVQFLDKYGFIKRNSTYTNFKTGVIKNPYDKTIYDIGYIGIGKYKVSEKCDSTDAYDSWHRVLERCYNAKAKKRFSAYYGICTVCDEWHNYQNYAEWYEKNAYECEGRLHLDKDILVPGNKLYSPDTCLLVPQRINMLFLNKPNKNDLPNGITKLKSGYKAEYNGKSCSPICDTLDEAYEYYAAKKEFVIKEIAEEYKNVIPQKLYDALLRYKVDINIDKNYIPDM